MKVQLRGDFAVSLALCYLCRITVYSVIGVKESASVFI